MTDEEMKNAIRRAFSKFRLSVAWELVDEIVKEVNGGRYAERHISRYIASNHNGGCKCE